MLEKFLKPFTLMLALSFAPHAIAAGTPTDDVRTSVEAILAVLQNTELEKQQKRAEMSKIINERFDFRAMAQRTLATNWKKTSDAQKQQFTELFSQLIESSYVGKLEAYTTRRSTTRARRSRAGRRWSRP